MCESHVRALKNKAGMYGAHFLYRLEKMKEDFKEGSLTGLIV